MPRPAAPWKETLALAPGLIALRLETAPCAGGAITVALATQSRDAGRLLALDGRGPRLSAAGDLLLVEARAALVLDIGLDGLDRGRAALSVSYLHRVDGAAEPPGSALLPPPAAPRVFRRGR